MITDDKYIAISSHNLIDEKNLVEINNQDILITQNGIYSADAGYTGLGLVTVDVTPPKMFGLTVNQLDGSIIDGALVYGTENPAPNFTGITRTRDYMLYYRFYNREDLTGNLVFDSNLTTINSRYALYYAFYYCTHLTATGMQNITSITSTSPCTYAFANCFGLTKTDLDNLVEINGDYACMDMFGWCNNLTDVGLGNLTTISGSASCYDMFRYCVGLENVTLTSLTNIQNGGLAWMFTYCLHLANLSFPALTSNSFGTRTNQFEYMLSGVTGCTVHFPSNLQSVIGGWTDVINGFGGTNTTVLFDLPATE